MKSGSQLQGSAPHEDWVDESWIVDCICGVNFDDGEEMVNCDVCGVWEHTRCSRYVKGQEEFACSKCKIKNNLDSKETEVAQLLVELPTKTVRMENSYAMNVASRRHPLRLWTREERVHVQGIPGGDPRLFIGQSPVFSQQLWKCSGYVPKNLNFKYREFPCWDGKGNNGGDEIKEEGREIDLAANLVSLVGKGGDGEDYGYERKGVVKETKTSVGAGDLKKKKKEKTLIRPILIHSSKRKKEEYGIPSELCGKKKKSRITEKDLDAKKRISPPRAGNSVLRIHNQNLSGIHDARKNGGSQIEKIMAVSSSKCSSAKKEHK